VKIIAVVFLVLVGYFAWRFVFQGDALVLLTPDSGQRVVAVVNRVIPDKELVIEIDNNSKENRITGISMPRQLVSRIGLSVPPGFEEQALPLTGEDRKDRELVEYVEKYNMDNIRWVGNRELTPNAVTEFTFPVTSANRLAGHIDFQYEAKVGFGGSISSFRVNLEDTQTNETPQSPSRTDGSPGS
jgi:hypothetical protein